MHDAFFKNLVFLHQLQGKYGYNHRDSSQTELHKKSKGEEQKLTVSS